MLLLRMAIAPTFYTLLNLLIFARAVCASPRLSLGVSAFIPACAEQCVLSFIDISFSGQGCGPDFSLECLCSTRGRSEFTLGEAAVQCITAESQIGSCSGNDASRKFLCLPGNDGDADMGAESARDAAYFMCENQKDSINPTHTLITASLLLPTASGDFVSFPPVEATTADPHPPLPTSLPTTLVTETRPPPPRPTITRGTIIPKPTETVESSTEATGQSSSSESATQSSSSGSGTTIAVPPSETSAENDEDNEEDGGSGGPTLNTGQVAGISVGVAAAAAIAIGAVFLARYCRRKRHPDVKTGFFPRRSTWGYRVNNGDSEPRGGGGEDSRRNTLWPPSGPAGPVHDPPMQAVPPPAYTRQSTHPRASTGPDAIGLALSPPFKRDPASQSPSARRLSKLLPAKPVMPPMFARLTGSPQESPGSSSRDEGPPQLPPLTGFMTKQSPPRDRNRPSSPRTEAIRNIPPRIDSVRPYGTQNDSIRPVQSQPEEVRNSPPRQEEKQLPPVPLTLQIPQTGTVTAADGISRARESTMTEFEEDSCLSPEGQVWRIPSAGPKSAAQSYVADKHGNWVLAPAQPAESPEPKTAPPTNVVPIFPPRGNVRRSSLSQGRVVQRPSLAPAATISPTEQVPRSQTAASSIYSQLSPTPRPLFYNKPGDQRHSSSASQTSRPPMDRASSRSSDITLFESSSDESKEPTPPEVRRTLTPVVESPRQEPGRSPVVYPQVPNRMRDGRQMGPPPSQRPYHPPGQPSPTLGIMQQQTQPQQGMPYPNMPARGRRPADNPSDVRSGSPPRLPTMRVVEPSPEPDDRGRLPSAHRPPSFNRPPSQVIPSFNPGRNARPYQQQYRQQPWRPQVGPYPQMQPTHRPAPQPLNQTNPRQSQGARPGEYESYSTAHSQPNAPSDYEPFALRQPKPEPSPLRAEFRPAPAPYRPQQQQLQPPRLQTNMPPAPPILTTFASPVSDASTSSSLLAKRLGSDRAAQMAIPMEQAHPKWDRGPRTPNQGLNQPTTPGWMPRLTPTRRGDDLFLNVQ